MADIVDVAVSAANLKTLVKAVQAAGLVETLKGKGPFTVFAPTDEAFAKLPAGTVEGLLKDTPKLTSILTYHVLPMKHTANDLRDGASLKTVQGQNLMIRKTGTITKKVMVNDATVIKADIMADNGVVHLIDKVIMPK